MWDILDPQPPDLLEPHRRYRQEGEVLFYEAKRKLRPRYLFLFNDVLLVTSKDNDKDKYVRGLARVRHAVRLCTPIDAPDLGQP